MVTWNRKKKAVVFMAFICIMFLLSILCWNKRRGIYNTFMKLTGQEIPFSVLEKRKKAYGYYEQKLNVSMDIENTVFIEENDASADLIETNIPKQNSLVATSYEIDRQLQEEQEKGYSFEEPLVVLNPYQISPLTAVIIFDTEKECRVRFTVKGKKEAADISGELDAASSHRIPVIGLYPDMENTVEVELLDEKGEVFEEG